MNVDLALPPPAAPVSLPHASQPPLEKREENAYDAVDAFFRVFRPLHSTRVRGIRNSRHDDVPPPYIYNNNDLPAYSSWEEDVGIKEPLTLAMYLFKYGFLFPIFWFTGCTILLTPLRAPEDWETGKCTEERVELVELIRKTEVK